MAIRNSLTGVPDRENLAATIKKLPTTTDDKNRTVDVVFYSGADVRRVGYDGKPFMLRFDPAGADLSLLNNGAPVLDSHNDYSGVRGQLGVVVQAWKNGDGGYMATLRFSPTPRVDEIWEDIKHGIVNKLSMGVQILDIEDDIENNLKIAKRWQPVEISMTPIPADFGTTTLSAAQRGKERNIMAGSVQTAGAAGAVSNQIRQIGLACHLSEGFIDGVIATGASVEKARTVCLNEQAALAEAQPETISHHAELVRDSGDSMRLGMEEALYSKMTGKAPAEIGREYMGARLSDMARDLLISRGVRVTTRDAGSIFRLSFAGATTSDFPNLLQSTGNRILLQAYQTAPAAIKDVARPSTVPDFRTKYLLRLGEAPKLLEVPESGEITTGPVVEWKESYAIATYARKFSLTRQALVNDDLAAFGDFFAQFGIAAYNMEANVIVGLLSANSGAGATMSDSNPLFHTDHNNLAASAAAIDVSPLSDARLALRTTTGLDGETIIAVEPRFILVPAALETAAQRVLAQIYPTKSDDVNPFGNGQLVLKVEPRLDAVSSTRWYLFGEPTLAPVLEYSYLEGQPGPRLETFQGVEVLGLTFRCFEDFGAGAIGWRGAYANDGK